MVQRTFSHDSIRENGSTRHVPVRRGVEQSKPAGVTNASWYGRGPAPAPTVVTEGSITRSTFYHRETYTVVQDSDNGTTLLKLDRLIPKEERIAIRVVYVYVPSINVQAHCCVRWIADDTLEINADPLFRGCEFRSRSVFKTPLELAAELQACAEVVSQIARGTPWESFQTKSPGFPTKESRTF